jgi:hypothetical protein
LEAGVGTWARVDSSETDVIATAGTAILSLSAAAWIEYIGVDKKAGGRLGRSRWQWNVFGDGEEVAVIAA